jgi:hypothetical protein
MTTGLPLLTCPRCGHAMISAGGRPTAAYCDELRDLCASL